MTKREKNSYIKSQEKEIEKLVKSINAPLHLEDKLNVLANVADIDLSVVLSNIQRHYRNIEYVKSETTTYEGASSKFLCGSYTATAKRLLAKYYNVSSLRHHSIQYMCETCTVVSTLATFLQPTMTFACINDSVYSTGFRPIDKIAFTNALMEILLFKNPGLRIVLLTNSSIVLNVIGEWIRRRETSQLDQIHINIRHNFDAGYDTYKYNGESYDVIDEQGNRKYGTIDTLFDSILSTDGNMDLESLMIR